MSRQPHQNYEKISKNFTEMCIMTETNSENIISLISLIKSQNKSIQTLQRQVYKLQGKIGAEDAAECCNSEHSDSEHSDTEEDEEKTNVKVSEVYCDLCEDRHTALYHCKDCSENLCETIAGIHKKGKATKGHLVLLLSDIEKDPDVDGSYEVPIYKESSKWNPTQNEGESKVSIRIGEFYGIVFSRKGEIYIVDSSKNPALFTKSGNYIRKISGKGIYPDISQGSMRIDSSDCLNIIIDDNLIWKKYILNSDGDLQNTISINKPTRPMVIEEPIRPGTFGVMKNTIINVADYNMDSIQRGEITENRVINPSGHKIFIFNKNSDKATGFSINLDTDLRTPSCIFVQLSPKDEIFVVDIANHVVKVFSQEGKFLRTIGRPSKYMFKLYESPDHVNTKLDNEELHFSISGSYRNLPSIQFTDNGNVYIQDKTRIQVFSNKGKFLYKVCECAINYILTGFAVSPVTGDVAVINHKHGTETYNIHVLEVTGKYTRKPKETHFTLNTTLVHDSEILTDTKVSSVTFPISIKRDANDNLFTRTLYFPETIPVKQSIHEVEEYFRKRITREEFIEVRSVCNFSSLQGELRGDYMNWDSCKKAKVIRGYFLGGEIIKELTVNEGNLFIHITDCFVSLK
jgi:DNA-binding beta-propeller fold protein YncE